MEIIVLSEVVENKNANTVWETRTPRHMEANDKFSVKLLQRQVCGQHDQLQCINIIQMFRC